MRRALRGAAIVLCAGLLAACGTSRPGGGPSGLDFASPRVLDGGSDLQCVPYARDVSGIRIFGDAADWWDAAAGRYARVFVPKEGAVIVLQGYNDSARGHLAVVRRLVSDRIIVVDHANWHNRGEVTIDAPIRDVSPANDWSEVQVWYADGQHWGRRVYRVTGFILPQRDYAGV